MTAESKATTCSTAMDDRPAVHVLDLTGRWQLQQARRRGMIPATVPGCVHTDLLAAGRIADPFIGDNELACQWVGETDWTYRRTFRVRPELLNSRRQLLRCEGLDTLARVYLGGRLIGSADNMYRTWEFDLTGRLKAGLNEIEIRFAAPVPYITSLNKKRKLPSWDGVVRIPGNSWLRKQPSSFGWDWGPKLATCGIWQPVSLVGFDEARMIDVQIRQDHSRPSRVALTVAGRIERETRSRLQAIARVSLDGRLVAETQVAFGGKSFQSRLEIPDPQLWWPNGMGGQPLYEVSVELRSSDGVLIDSGRRRIGLRTFELQQKKDRRGKTFQFVVNSRPFFAKGANWIPADALVTRVSDTDYRRLLTDAAAAHMNMIRVWGGGIYEADVFYDLCDELGLCVWQDFMFACATFPTFERDWLANVKVEAQQAVRRIRHHACLALWCGNNELEQGLVGRRRNEKQMSWADYSRLFDRLLPDVVAKNDPDTTYWPSSPHTPGAHRHDANDPTCGDAHLWQVWHGRKPFDFYRTCEHRFVSEFGFQSFPEPLSVSEYTESGERNLTSHVMEHHQRHSFGNSLIMQYMLDWFRLPGSFDQSLWLSQILQGLGIKIAVEHFRRSMPRCMGSLYWQLNDCWPVASWSSIDFAGRWKALHYFAKKFYAPLLLSAVVDANNAIVSLHVTSDEDGPREGYVVWRLIEIEGKLVDRGREPVRIGKRSTKRAARLDLSRPAGRYGRRRLVLACELVIDGQTVSEDLAWLCPPKHLELSRPVIRKRVRALSGGRLAVTLESDRPALWTHVDVGTNEARLSDNFFHLLPGRAKTVELTPVSHTIPADLRKSLTVMSLWDTWT